MAGYGCTDFLSRLCSIDQRAYNARRVVYCAHGLLVRAARGMLLFVLVINGGRQKPVNLGKERQFGSFVFAGSPLNNEARQQNKGAHGDGKSLLLERAQNKQNQSNGKMRRAGWIFLKCVCICGIYIRRRPTFLTFHPFQCKKPAPSAFIPKIKRFCKMFHKFSFVASKPRFSILIF
jgi:hypothetical protein